jgi:radical SAM protein with 4Fe4S-binding SPASM domain
MQNKGEHKGELIDFELYKKIINQIAEQRYVNGRDKIPLQLVFHGGEVLLLGKERLYKMLTYTVALFQTRGIQYALGCQTNATMLDDDFAAILTKFEVNVGLSFDGIDGGNNARTTTIKQDVFEKKFDILKRNKTQFGFLIVASKTNVDNMQATQQYLENLGLHETNTGVVRGYKINYAEDMINPGEDSEIELTGKEMFEKVWKPELERFIQRKKTQEYHTHELLTKSLVDILTYHGNESKSGCGTKWCGAGTHMIAIEPDGEMDYCDRYSKKFPEAYVQHALDYDFAGLHQIKKAIEYNIMKSSVYKETGCDTCYADYICDHGCEAFYKSKYGTYGIDTRIVCDQHKDFYRFVVEHLEEILQIYAEKGTPIAVYDQIYSIKENIRSKLAIAGINVTLEDNKLKVARDE